MYIHPIFWFVAAFAFMVFELVSPGFFYFLSFAFGSFAACIAGLYDYSLFDQIVLFFIVSICAGICLKRWVRRHGNRGNYRSNVHALIGKIGVVVTPHERTNYSVPGYMHVEGQVWAYTSPQDAAIQAGSLVEVIDVRGAHLVVKPVVE